MHILDQKVFLLESNMGVVGEKPRDLERSQGQYAAELRRAVLREEGTERRGPTLVGHRDGAGGEHALQVAAQQPAPAQGWG